MRRESFFQPFLVIKVERAGAGGQPDAVTCRRNCDEQSAKGMQGVSLQLVDTVLAFLLFYPLTAILSVIYRESIFSISIELFAGLLSYN